MMNLLALCAVSTTALGLAGSPLNAQSFHRESAPRRVGPAVSEQRVGSISGRVVDSATSRPLANVQVAVAGTRFAAPTREDGGYTIAGVPAGQYTLRATSIGRV